MNEDEWGDLDPVQRVELAERERRLLESRIRVTRLMANGPLSTESGE